MYVETHTHNTFVHKTLLITGKKRQGKNWHLFIKLHMIDKLHFTYAIRFTVQDLFLLFRPFYRALNTLRPPKARLLNNADKITYLFFFFFLFQFFKVRTFSKFQLLNM